MEREPNSMTITFSTDLPRRTEVSLQAVLAGFSISEGFFKGEGSTGLASTPRLGSDGESPIGSLPAGLRPFGGRLDAFEVG